MAETANQLGELHRNPDRNQDQVNSGGIRQVARSTCGSVGSACRSRRSRTSQYQDPAGHDGNDDGVARAVCNVNPELAIVTGP